MQTAVRKGRLILIFGAIPPPRNFAKIRTRGGRGLLPIQPRDSIPPWGTQRNAAGAARRLCRSQAGGGALAAVCLGGRGAGGVSPGRRGQGAAPGGAAGASGRGEPEPSFRAAFRRGGAGGLARVRRTKAAWRARRRGAGTLAGRRGAGGLWGFPGRTRGRSGGRRGGKAGAAPRCRGAAGGGAGKTAAPSAACVGFQATSAIEAAGGRKSPISPYKEALFSGRSSCQIRAVLRPNPCLFGRVAFSAARSDECVTPGGAGEKPRQKTKRPSERSAPHEKPDFRYRD